ncbi:MAG TPA: bifunctional enoyl-CoA hydratase/phosphate acetyltransferase [Thiomonas arsenitoxydans]|uniref:bifunctional enoyl-CoA hydratase/phosphate acetyltransferase n=1 Tax=Thiomonas TaxID=32012 RepID=UPI00257ABBDC|nr:MULTISPECIES: bifunctional enoyl-CoA hydratase/phosphate acetyltransferase [Thiomonas]HML83205.1 bifunctional enoyl-CoA hydratase/phosphate acetyltransferase [Thiomonas arsenitoxydans]
MTDTICNRTFDEISLGDSATLQRTLTRADISTFAVMSGDANPSHVDEEFARSTPFHQVVAHGMWSGMLLSNLLGTELPGPGTVYVDQSLSFDHPVMLGDTVTASVTAREKLTERHQIRFDCKVVNQRGETIASGQALVQAPTQKICRPRTHLPQLHLVDPGQRLLALVSKAREGCKGLKPMRVAVVHPVNAVSIQGAIDAAQAGLIEPVWIGPETRIRAAAEAAGIDLSPWQLMSTEHSHAAAALAVELARNGKVGALMKGALHTDELMHAAFDAQTGLRTGRRASHVFVIDAPAADRLLFITDAAINIAPDLDTKRDIAQNAIELAQALGVETPRMAILAAVETVNANMAATLHAAALCKMADRGQITGAILDGPLAFDNALSLAAAKTKGINSPVAGLADILLTPDLESGNMLAKQLEYLGGATIAGLVIGTRVPIILTSRADGVEARLASCALAVLQRQALLRAAGQMGTTDAATHA